VRVALWSAILVVGATVAVLAAAFAWSLPAPSDSARSVGVNALWARHSWAGEAHGSDELDRFAERLRTAGISDVFAHVGPLDADGSLPADRHPHAADLVAGLHGRVPGLRVQAHLDGEVRVADRSVRERTVAAAGTLVDAGFDGVHYDLRPGRVDDPAFLDLLARTRAVTGARGAVVSVAVDGVAPHPALAPLQGRPDLAGLRAVADRVDQVAVRTGGSGLPTASAFAAWQAWQTEQVAGAIGPRVVVFVAVPAAPVSGAGRGETMAAGLRGLRRGLDALGPSRAGLQPVGAAVATEWTATEEDWRVFGDEWAQVGSASGTAPGPR
jgi:hypothetical protein